MSAGEDNVGNASAVITPFEFQFEKSTAFKFIVFDTYTSNYAHGIPEWEFSPGAVIKPSHFQLNTPYTMK